MLKCLFTLKVSRSRLLQISTVLRRSMAETVYRGLPVLTSTLSVFFSFVHAQNTQVHRRHSTAGFAIVSSTPTHESHTGPPKEKKRQKKMAAQHSHGRRCPTTSGNRQVSRSLRSEGTYNGNKMVVEDVKCSGHGGGTFEEAVATSAGRISRRSAVPRQRCIHSCTHERSHKRARTHTPFETEPSRSAPNAIEVPACREQTRQVSRTHPKIS